MTPAMSSTLPHVEWVWGPDGRRKEVWVFPSGEENSAPEAPGEIARDSATPSSDPAPHGDTGDDQRAVQFTAVSMPPVKTSSKLDEFALDVLLAQCGNPKPGSKR